MKADLSISKPLVGALMSHGDHFRAYSFRKYDVGEVMNPLLMFDHFWMKRDTFGWHAHSGISAVSYVFEDSKSTHHNSDSMGDRSPIHPGSLHWMVAGSGAMHREQPEGDDALVHALQFFVDLPQEAKSANPYAIHVESGVIPKLVRAGISMRVVAGAFADVKSPAVLPQPFLLYDILQEQSALLNVPLPSRWGAWLYVVSGRAELAIDGHIRILEQRQAVALNTGSKERLATIRCDHLTQAVLLGGADVRRDAALPT